MTRTISQPIALRDTAAGIPELWRPKLVGALNGQAVKVARLKGEFIWHAHAGEDELFLVLEGKLRIDFRRGGEAEWSRTIAAGEMLIVPRGIEHRPVAVDEVLLLLFEPLGTRNTGDREDPMFTAPTDVAL
jgi:mannose-6-phosphate isomerase-like protein (cupin superfamily)